MIERFILFFLFTFQATLLLSQDSDGFFIENYGAKDYEASVSNWDLEQGNNQIFYFANLEGVLAFNSTNWQYLATTSATFSIAKDSNNRIYYGNNSDFGYLGVNEHGQLQLNSLAKNNVVTKDIGFIWDIISCNGNVYFFSKARIYQWTGEKLKTIEADSSNMFQYKLQCLDNQVYIVQENRGMGLLQKGALKFINGTKTIADDNLIFLKKKEKQLSLITRRAGLYKLKDSNLNFINDFSLNNLRLNVYNLKPLHHENKLGLATLTDGLIITDSLLQPKSIINKKNGLQSNAIKDLFIDSSQNIWTAMQEGISYIEYGSPLRQKIKKSEINGVITSLEKVDNDIWIGTTETAYILSKNDLLPLNDVKERVWSIQKLDSYRILISTLSNNLLYDENQNPKKAALKNTIHVSLLYDEHKTIDLYRSGVSIVDKNFKVLHDIIIGEESWADAKLDTNKTLWASAKFKGIYKITDIETQDPKIDLFTTKNGLPDVKEIHITTYDDSLLFTTSQGLYTFKASNPDSSKFIPYLGKLNPQGYVKQVKKDSNGNYYFTIQDGRIDHLEKYELQPDGSFKRIYKPFKRLPDMEITALLPDRDSILWIAGSEGLFKYDGKIKKDYNQPFNTLVSQVSTSDSLIFGGYYTGYTADNTVPYLTIEQPTDAQPVLSYDHNNLTFEFAATFYEVPHKNQFSYFLKNNDVGWSKWSTETKKEYTNLSAGRYVFMVKSKNIYDNEGKTATYSFTILPPWYQTTWAYVGYVALAMLFIWFIILIFTYRVRMHRRRLKLIVADRTYEVITQKKEIESQNLLLKDQFEEISKQRDEIQQKNAKLELSQEEILTINNKLKELNMSLEKKVEQRTFKIKATLQKLKHANKELDTFVYRASHDLKGPISRIHGLTSLAKLESIDEESNKYYNLIEHAALDMQGLLSKLTNAYEIMNKEINEETVDIPSLLSEIRNSVKFLEDGTKYTFDIQDKLSVLTDSYLIKIVIENLMQNALIFRKKIAPFPHEVSIKCYQQNKYFYFQIADNGIGVRPEHSQKIYDMFFRGSDQSQGSGLGLYIVKMALERIKGSIELDTTLFEYSVFTVKIPIR